MRSPDSTPLATAGPIAERLSERFETWRCQPMLLHLLALVLLALVMTLRWWPNIFAAQPMNDEMIYFRAFRNTANGLSPFDRSGYLSFSLLAHLGGWSLTHLGEGPTLALVRAGNLAGVCTATWCATAWAPWGLRGRWVAASLYLALAPAVGFGIVMGNLSLLVSGMIILALYSWPRQGILGGSLLGASIIAKPLAPGAIVALLAHRPADRGRAHLLAGGIAVALTAAIALGSPELGRAVELDPWPRLARSVSPHRLGHLLGLEGSVIWITFIVAALTVLVARRRRLGPTQLMAIALTATVAMTPVVWSHTLIVTLPLQALALALAWQSSHQRSVDPASEARRSPWVELTAVALAVAAIQLSEGGTNLYDQHPVIQWMGALPPMFAPALLTAYVLRRTTRR